VRFQTFPNASFIVNLRSNSANSSHRINISTNTTTNNHLIFRIQNTAVGISDFSCDVGLSTDTTYFAIFKWDSSQNDRRCEVYDSGGASVGTDEDLTTSFSAYLPMETFPVTDGLYFGEWSGVAIQFYMDNIFLASTYADADTIYCNRGITSYTSYAACSSGTVRNLMMMGVGN